MTEPSDSPVLQDFAALLALLDAKTMEDASDVVQHSTEFDACFMEQGDGIVLRFGQLGWELEFPMTVDFFWQGVEDLDADITALHEDED